MMAALLATPLLAASTDLDTFGIARFYPTRAGTREWTSAHWANTKVRTVKYAEDAGDPTGWTEDHSGGTDGFRIDGQGTMTMSGSGPRFHVNSMDSSKVAAQSANWRRIAPKPSARSSSCRRSSLKSAIASRCARARRRGRMRF